MFLESFEAAHVCLAEVGEINLVLFQLPGVVEELLHRAGRLVEAQ